MMQLLRLSTLPVVYSFLWLPIWHTIFTHGTFGNLGFFLIKWWQVSLQWQSIWSYIWVQTQVTVSHSKFPLRVWAPHLNPSSKQKQQPRLLGGALSADLSWGFMLSHRWWKISIKYGRYIMTVKISYRFINRHDPEGWPWPWSAVIEHPAGMAMYKRWVSVIVLYRDSVTIAQWANEWISLSVLPVERVQFPGHGGVFRGILPWLITLCQ